MKKSEVRRLILAEAIEAARQGYPPEPDEVLALLKAAGRHVPAAQSVRLGELEQVASARFRIFTEGGICLVDKALEELFIHSKFAGGDVLDLNGFTGKIVIT